MSLGVYAGYPGRVLESTLRSCADDRCLYSALMTPQFVDDG